MTSSASAAWAAVVINYESGPVLVECVQALRADRSAGAVEIVVVDNGSTDGSIEALRAAEPEVTVLQPGANLGYGRAANLGIAATDAPIVAVFNPDAFLAPGSARAVLDAFAADPDLGVVGPRIENPDGSIYPSARVAPGVVVAVGHALLGQVLPAEPVHDGVSATGRRYRPSPARSTGSRARRSGFGGQHSTGWAGGTSVTSCSSRTSMCAARCVRTMRRIRYEPQARVMHVVGTSRAGAPVRSIVRHHRSAYRYLDKWWKGPQRLALPAAGRVPGGSRCRRRDRRPPAGAKRGRGVPNLRVPSG